MMETFAALLLALAASELLDPCRGGRAEVPGLWVLRSVLFLALAMLESRVSSNRRIDLAAIRKPTPAG